MGKGSQVQVTACSKLMLEDTHICVCVSERIFYLKIFVVLCVFGIVLFCFFEMGFLCIALAVLCCFIRLSEDIYTHMHAHM